MKKEFELAEGLFVLTAGLVLFLVLVIGVVLICSVTLNKVNKFKSYCDEQFEKITSQIEASNSNIKELTDLVKELNSKL
jgi:sensor domain CHASE-containing protein